MTAASASFERIDYQLRNNKHIERRLMFDRLARAASIIDYSNYRYLGFGSMWFVDFRLAHRILGIAEMVSMERAAYADRAMFNQPFRCIRVVSGESGNTIAAISFKEWERPVICWLDYDGSLDSAVTSDIGAVLNNAAAGSVIVVSINANLSNYRPRDSSTPRRRIDTALGQVESILKAAVVAPRFERTVTPGGSQVDLSAAVFPEFLAVALLSSMMHNIRGANRKPAWAEAGDGGELLEFLPLFNFCHKDGADMVTVGGAIVDSRNRHLWKDKVGVGIDWSTLDPGLPVHERIDLIPITIQEKLMLDSCLPHGIADFLSKAKEKGLKISDDQLRKYWSYYKQFPLFFDTSL